MSQRRHDFVLPDVEIERAERAAEILDEESIQQPQEPALQDARYARAWWIGE